MSDRLFSYGAPLGGYIDPATGKLAMTVGGPRQPVQGPPTPPVDTNLITAPGMGLGTYPEPLAKLRQWFDPETYGPTGGATWEQPSAVLPMAMHPGPGGVPEEKPAIPRAIKEAAQYGIDLLASPWTGGVPESFVAGTAMNALTGGHDPSQLGMFLGKTAKNFPAREARRAALMAKEGLDTPLIYRTTGVDPKGIKSTADNPFFEISDRPAVYHEDRAQPGTTTTLGALYDHPELYANHPELADMPVNIGPEGGSGYPGQYDPVSNSISLSADVAGSRAQAESVITHELQHAIQTKEGWPSGANPEFMGKLERQGSGAATSLKIRDWIKRHPAPEGYDDRQWFTQHHPWAPGNVIVDQAFDPKLSAAELRRYAKVFKAGQKVPEAARPMELYRRTAGEYQSRMAQERAYMTPEELRDIHPTDYARAIKETPEAAQIKIDKFGSPIAAPVNAFFDLSNLEQVPDVPQGPLERYTPPRGISPRLQSVLENKDIQKRIKGIVEQGVKMGGQRWYNTEPLRQAFIDELGDTEGQIAYTRYMDYVAATSPRSKVPENVRNASYYYARERQGLPQPTPKPSAEFPANPKPYGHMAQALHRQNAQTIAGGGFDIFKNPKPPSFSANLQGNQFPVTVDAHATKLPAMLSQDPRWLETNVREPVPGAKGEFQNIKPPALYKSGEMTVEQALEKPTYWSGQPNPNEYAGLENMYQDIAKSVGVTPAQAQASAWIAGGKLTGLGSDSAKAFMDFFQERLLFTAEQFGESPKTALRKFIRGERPLLGVSMSPSAIGDSLRAMNKEQQQPPPTGDRLLQTMGSQS